MDKALWTTTQQISAIQSGELTSRDLLEIYIDRIDRLNPAINAVITRDFEAARKQADDIDKARSYNFDGVVFGATLLNGELDQEFLDQLIRYSDGLKKTLHRAVDTIPKTIEAVEIAINLGFDTILSSGGYETAMEGLAVLTEMQQIASSRIEIMPGSGINPQNISEILSECGFAWLHSSCSTHRQNRKITDSQTIKEIKNAINV